MSKTGSNPTDSSAAAVDQVVVVTRDVQQTWFQLDGMFGPSDGNPRKTPVWQTCISCFSVLFHSLRFLLVWFGVEEAMRGWTTTLHSHAVEIRAKLCESIKTQFQNIPLWVGVLLKCSQRSPLSSTLNANLWFGGFLSGIVWALWHIKRYEWFQIDSSVPGNYWMKHFRHVF